MRKECSASGWFEVEPCSLNVARAPCFFQRLKLEGHFHHDPTLAGIGKAPGSEATENTALERDRIERVLGDEGLTHAAKESDFKSDVDLAGEIWISLEFGLVTILEGAAVL